MRTSYISSDSKLGRTSTMKTRIFINIPYVFLNTQLGISEKYSVTEQINVLITQFFVLLGN